MIPRYSIPELEAIWTDEHKIKLWLRIEQTAMNVMHKHGAIPERITFSINDASSQEFISACKEKEKSTQHDVVAFLSVLEDALGKPGRYIHYGMTSSDLVDTGLALQMKESVGLIQDTLAVLCSAVLEKAVEHKNTLIMARTHGRFAEPSTFGLVLLNHYSELCRHITRLVNVKSMVAVGKLSGSIGLYAYVPPTIEQELMKVLELTAEPISSQIVARDRHAELISELALLATAIERLALEIRLLARSDVQELAEGHGSGYKGSSSMPHKVNPIVCENLCGLTRVVRSYVAPMLEDVALWHERDISHSSVERLVIPDAFGIVYYMIKRMTKVIKELWVDKQKMESRVRESVYQWTSQSIMLDLIDQGMSRQEAHTAVQHDLFSRTNDEPIPTTDERLARHLKHVDEIFSRFEDKHETSR